MRSSKKSLLGFDFLQLNWWKNVMFIYKNFMTFNINNLGGNFLIDFISGLQPLDL